MAATAAIKTHVAGASEAVRSVADLVLSTAWHAGEVTCGAIWAWTLAVAIRLAAIFGKRLPANVSLQERSLKDQVVLITGGAAGIGRLMAERFAVQQGCKVVIWDIVEPLLVKAKAEIEQLLTAAGGHAGHGSIHAYRVDVTDRDAIYRVAKQVEREVGPVSILINNAGVVDAKPFLQTDDASILRTFNVNALAPAWTTKAFLPGMIAANKGNLVFVSSATALAAVNGMADYSASKSAVFGLAESIRLEVKQIGADVHTTTVCPYFIDTGMFHGVKTKWPRLLPILKPEHVADEIVRAVKTNNELVVLPSFAYISYLFRLVLPTWMVDGASRFFGVTDSLKTFQGKKPEERVELTNGVSSTASASASAAPGDNKKGKKGK